MAKHPRENLFRLNGVPPLGASVSLALQHLVSMIVGCVTPAIILANVIGLPQAQRVLLIQSSLVVSAISTLLQLFPIGGGRGGFRFGSGLPVILGVSFAYVPSMQAIAAGGGGLAAIAGAMVVGGAVALAVGLLVEKIRVLFPPVITGTVVFTIGLSPLPHGHQLYGRRHLQHLRSGGGDCGALPGAGIRLLAELGHRGADAGGGDGPQPAGAKASASWRRSSWA